MKKLKNLCVISSLLAGMLCAPGVCRMTQAVSDEAIYLHEKQKEFVKDVTLYYFKNNKEVLPEFIQKLNEEQLQIMFDAFSFYGQPNVFYYDYASVLGLNFNTQIEGLDLLNAAIRANNLEFVKLIIENCNISDVNETDSLGCGSPLWVAHYNNCSYEMIDYLFSVGADPHTEYGKGYVPELFERFEKFKNSVANNLGI